jgi:uncharacterized membrane protein
VARTSFSDLDLDRQLAAALRAGVMFAAAIVAAGAVLYLVRHGAETPAYQAFRGEPADLRSIAGIWRAAWSFSGRGIIQFGLLLLIATPVARVLLSVIGFVRERDWLYVQVTAVVFALLMYSLLDG